MIKSVLSFLTTPKLKYFCDFFKFKYMNIELANVLAWDAVGAQIKPYLVQHAEWQRPCGVALGCSSLNSCGIKMLLQAAVF